MRLSGKTIVITGGASGIGAAAAAKCRAEGARVVVFDRADGDVSDEAQVKAFFDGIGGSLDGLVNSAGIAVRQTVLDQDVESWDRVMAVNVKGAFLCSKHALPKMIRSGGGSIVHLSSVVGVTGVRNRSAYSTSKGAIIALTRNMALDFAGHQVRVNCVCPGFTRTPLTEGLLSDPGREAKLLALHPLGRLGEAEDIANAISFLLSSEASWITGQALAVDGGFTAGHAVDV